MKYLKTMGIVASALLLLFLTACGGNSNSGTPTPTLTLSPTTADIILGNSRTFTVTATNTDFTVTGNGCTKNNATTVVCTPTSEGTHELTVTATADASLTRKATMTVKKVDIAIATATGETEVEVMVGESVAFVVTTTNTDFNMTAPGSAGCVRANDVITCTPTVYGTYNLVVTANEDTSKTAEATLTATEPEPGIFDDMVFVTGETYTMGCDPAIVGSYGLSCSSTNRPPHQVTLSDFYIGKYEVTRAQWREVVNQTADSGHGLDADPSEFKEFEGVPNDNLPVTNISWDDVQKFIMALNSLPENVDAGRIYRLPTEAEWEYVARGGNQPHGYMYIGWDGSGEGIAEKVGWLYSNSNGTTHPVGTLPASELGVFDMAGNVSEWCSDFYNLYSSEAQINPTGPVNDDRGNLVRRVTRGGRWNTTGTSALVWSRGYLGNTASTNYIGFRLVLTIAEP